MFSDKKFVNSYGGYTKSVKTCSAITQKDICFAYFFNEIVFVKTVVLFGPARFTFRSTVVATIQKNNAARSRKSEN